jgi:hypothetical protein
MILPDPKVLDQQSTTPIDRWVDLHSQECKEMDDFHRFTIKVFETGRMAPATLHLDALGRIWMLSGNGRFYPFHFEYQGKMIGYRIVAQASN